MWPWTGAKILRDNEHKILVYLWCSYKIWLYDSSIFFIINEFYTDLLIRAIYYYPSIHLRILNLIYSYHLSHENKLTTWHTCSISLRATCSWRRTLTAVLKEVSHQTATTDPATPGVHIDQCNVFIIYHMHSLVCKKYYKYVITTNEAAIYRRYM